MKAYSLASRFLTILPWPAAPEESGPGDFSSAVSRFPFVGLALGVMLVVLDTLLSLFFPAPVRNALLIIALIIFTGGLHLKALAGWMDAVGPATLGASSFGSLGTVSLAGIFLLKFAALLALPDEGRWSALLLAPVLGRAAVAYLLGNLPKDESTKDEELGGTVAPFVRMVSTDEAYAAAGWALAISVVLGFFGGLIVALAVGAATYGLRRYADESEACVGAGEVMETLAFLLFSAWWGS